MLGDHAHATTDDPRGIERCRSRRLGCKHLYRDAVSTEKFERAIIDSVSSLAWSVPPYRRNRVTLQPAGRQNPHTRHFVVEMIGGLLRLVKKALQREGFSRRARFVQERSTGLRQQRPT